MTPKHERLKAEIADLLRQGANAATIAAHLGVKRDLVDDVMDELDTNPPPIPETEPDVTPPKETPVLTVELEWCEPPPSARTNMARSRAVDAIVEQLQTRPGCWAAVERGKTTSSMPQSWKRRGCEAVMRMDPGSDPKTWTIYARWPA